MGSNGLKPSITVLHGDKAVGSDEGPGEYGTMIPSFLFHILTICVFPGSPSVRPHKHSKRQAQAGAINCVRHPLRQNEMGLLAARESIFHEGIRSKGASNFFTQPRLLVKIGKPQRTQTYDGLVIKIIR